MTSLSNAVRRAIVFVPLESAHRSPLPSAGAGAAPAACDVRKASVSVNPFFCDMGRGCFQKRLAAPCQPCNASQPDFSLVRKQIMACKACNACWTQYHGLRPQFPPVGNVKSHRRASYSSIFVSTRSCLPLWRPRIPTSPRYTSTDWLCPGHHHCCVRFRASGHTSRTTKETGAAGLPPLHSLPLLRGSERLVLVHGAATV